MVSSSLGRLRLPVSQRTNHSLVGWEPLKNKIENYDYNFFKFLRVRSTVSKKEEELVSLRREYHDVLLWNQQLASSLEALKEEVRKCKCFLELPAYMEGEYGVKQPQ